MAEEKKRPREGDERLSGNSREGPRRTSGRDKPSTKQPARKAAGTIEGRKAKAANDVGRALRSVYDSTLREQVPQDFLNLLGRLD